MPFPSFGPSRNFVRGPQSTSLNDLLGPPPADVFGQLTGALSQGAPVGLTQSDLQRLFARAGTGAQVGTQSALSALARSLGGNVGSPLYQAQASRLRAGGGSRAAGAIADIKLQDARMKQAAEFQHRGQLAQASGLQATFQNLRGQSLSALLNFLLGSRKLDFQIAQRGRKRFVPSHPNFPSIGQFVNPAVEQMIGRY